MTLETQVKDPRLGMVTITDAKLTPDLREATLYYTVYGTDEERQSSAMALESAKGVLRKTVGQQTGVRYTPSLQFVADVVPETAGKIEELLARARAADAHHVRTVLDACERLVARRPEVEVLSTRTRLYEEEDE